jgi:uncharacterized membrane protein YphA (DoxX/SURF4 family)
MPATGSARSAGSGAGIRIASFGHALFAVTMIGLGIIGLMKGGFTAIGSGVRKNLPGRAALAYLCAAILLGAGIGLLWKRAAALSSRVLLAYFALWMLLFRLPLLAHAPKDPSVWWACGEIAVMIAGAWVLAVTFGGDRPGAVTGAMGLRLARGLYGFGLIQFGIAHFTFLQRTVSMVPGWLPGHLAWAYFTGGAMIAAGVAIVLGMAPRLAAVLSAWELSLFTLLVWVPVLVTGPDASSWNEFVDSWALTAAAWVVAESYRGLPWLALGTRPTLPANAPAGILPGP